MKIHKVLNLNTSLNLKLLDKMETKIVKELSDLLGKKSIVGPTLTSNKLFEIESVTGVNLTEKMKHFLLDLSLLNLNIFDSKYYLECRSIHPVPAHMRPFGRMTRVKVPIFLNNNLILSNNFRRDYYEWINSFNGSKFSLNNKRGSINELYPLPFGDSYGDGHFYICIDFLGRVVEFNYEMDEDDTNVLSNSQDEFVDKLYISKYND